MQIYTQPHVQDISIFDKSQNQIHPSLQFTWIFKLKTKLLL